MLALHKQVQERQTRVSGPICGPYVLLGHLRGLEFAGGGYESGWEHEERAQEDEDAFEGDSDDAKG